MTTAPTFWNRMAHRYSLRPISNIPAYEHTMERVRHYLKPDDTVLELGCGTGSTALLLTDAAAHITASDYSSGMIEIGREKAHKQRVQNVDFVVAGAQEAAGETYDVVMAFNLFHLIADRRRAFSAVHAKLAPGGLFISKTPCLSGWMQLLRVPIGVMQLIGKAPYLAYFSAAALEKQIKAAGFEFVEAVSIPVGGRSRFIVARKI